MPHMSKKELLYDDSSVETTEDTRDTLASSQRIKLGLKVQLLIIFEYVKKRKMGRWERKTDFCNNLSLLLYFLNVTLKMFCSIITE